MQINSEYILIENQKDLDILSISLKNSKIISVDTESSGFFTYYPRICLIQISSKGKNYILDTEKGLNFDALRLVFEDPGILKIFHSAGDDLRALWKDFQFHFSNIADTMYSSLLLCMEHHSLEYLIQKFYGIFISKKMQKSNWTSRPLRKEQLQYAALDTAFLEGIWEKMEKMLMENGLTEEAFSEFEKISRDAKQKFGEPHKSSWHQFPDVMKFTGIERRMIQDILEYREEKSKRANKAPFRVLNHHEIRFIVSTKNEPTVLLKKFGEKMGNQLLQIINNPSGGPLEKEDIPRSERELMSVEDSAIFNRLKTWKINVGELRGFHHTVLPSNKMFLEILKKKPDSLDALKEMDLFSSWKLQYYGPTILLAMQGKEYQSELQKLWGVKTSC